MIVHKDLRNFVEHVLLIISPSIKEGNIFWTFTAKRIYKQYV